MKSQLSQREIDAAFDSPANAAGDGNLPVAAFDFTRLDRIPKSQMRALQQLHENFNRSVASSLAVYLRTFVSMSLMSMEQVSYAEYLDGLSSPTFIAYISLRPYDGTAVMEISPGLVFTMLEMLLGGGGKTAPAAGRKITEVEKELMHSILRILIRGLHSAWADVVDVHFEVQSLADEPYLVHVLSPAEAVVAIGIEARVGQATEKINLAFPSIFIKQLRHMFDRMSRRKRSESKPEDRAKMADLLRAVSMNLEVRLEGGSVLTRDLLALKPGDVLQLDYPAERKAIGLVNGQPRYWGTLTRTGQNIAYEIACEYDSE